MELTNSKRLMYSASYVTTQLTPEEQRDVESKPGGGLTKANMLRSLDLKPRDLDRLRTAMDSDRAPRNRDEQKKVYSIAQRLAVTERPMSTMELATALAPLSYDAITHFIELSLTVKESSIWSKILLDLSKRRRKIAPIGRIHLERIEMYPAGVQKGELVFSVPMAPGETVTISHKEWSTSTREFEEIVQDYFESYSERGVAEKTDALMSIENEVKHSSAINFSASASGSYTGVTLTTTLGLSATNDERQSVRQSMQKNREVTEKASARSRKEHKVSIKLETKQGTEDRSAKTITNKAATAIRIDYFRMMRKWRVDLFRYGLRQTYDIAIPLPGVRLWALHQRVAELDKELRTPFVFGLKAEDLNDGNWPAKAAEFGVPSAVVPRHPDAEFVKTITFTVGFPESDADTRFYKLDFEVPPGYVLKHALAWGQFVEWPGRLTFKWLGGNSYNDPGSYIYTGDLAKLIGQSGALAAPYMAGGVRSANLTLTLTYLRTEAAYRTWKVAAWAAIKASAEARYQEKLAGVQEERDRLWRQLNGKDTLSLRRLEREELVRLVMQWLLGPGYPVVTAPGDGAWTPPPLQETMSQMLIDELAFQTTPTVPLTPNFNPTFSGITEEAWVQALDFGESVKFIHQAIEWENLLYFLYPYFWGSEELGRDKLLFEHNDPEHERFLRAGYTRIVLPVRPGFEEDFTHLLEDGALPKDVTAPYLTVAQDIANFARTNYAGIPPANPELHARPLLFPEQRATWDLMQETMKDIDAFKADNGHYPAKLSDLPSGSPLDAWGNELVYRMPGLGADYDLVSLGADNEVGGEGLDADISSAAGASLVATWFDYTPTSALDIEVDTKPEDIA
jgi:Type II secretion system (T2SS), protein G